MKRHFRDFLPAGDLFRRLQAVLASGAIVGVGLTTTAPAAEARNVLTTATPTIVDRSKKVVKLVLKLPGRAADTLIQHRSHSSHSSHRSHSSHASHYSGSSSVPAPRPSRSVPTPAPVAETLPPTSVPETPKIGAFDAIVQSVNREARTVTVKALSPERVHIISYRDDTEWEPVAGVTSRLDEYLDLHNSVLPFGVGHKVRITWKLSADTKKTIATKIALQR